MTFLTRVLRAIPLLVISPLLVAVSFVSLLLTDVCWLLAGRRRRPGNTIPQRRSASVVIPNWNGRDLLGKYLPSVEAALAGNVANEIIVVDNGSTDGSAEFLQRSFPGVKLVGLERNLGFGGGSNAGFRAAKNDIVVLLNSDMRVEPDFLQPLLDGFTDEKAFAVSCQIFFTDPNKQREETGLTQGWWQDGNLRVRHRIDEGVRDLFPCFYGGGGSCAFDRRKFLELGGFDELLAPFYLEDTDLGYLAWKRGWKVLYQPRSIVYHEHRGTIGRRFDAGHVQAVLKKNFLLFCWKNTHELPRLTSHFFFSYAGALLSVAFGDEPGRANLGAFWRAFSQLPGAVRSRWRARSLAAISDTETLQRPLGGYFHDRFGAFEPEPERLRVLFVSPYPILPPIHGGGVFMLHTLRELARRCEVHVVALLDYNWQSPVNQALRNFCASAEFLVRMEGSSSDAGSILPHAVREFSSQDLDWIIHRQIYQKRIDVLQLEYTPMGQYAGDYRNIVRALFEHDIYFQSVARGLEFMRNPVKKIKARLEYLRALRYELRLLPQLDSIQVCTRENKQYLASFRPELRPRLVEGTRACIDTASYAFRTAGRDRGTMLFLGSFRHLPNSVGLEWFIRLVLPLVVEKRKDARLLVAGSEPPPEHTYAAASAHIEMLGFVEDIRDPLARCAVFVCPVLSGSGVRVKLLEAFAAGIPVVSTRIGAEGLAREDGEFCLLADDPAEFARKVIMLLDDAELAESLALRARAEVMANWDAAVLTRRLESSYREGLASKRAAAPVGATLTSSPAPQVRQDSY